MQSNATRRTSARADARRTRTPGRDRQAAPGVAVPYLAPPQQPLDLVAIFHAWEKAIDVIDDARRVRERHARVLREILLAADEELAVVVDPERPGVVNVLVLDEGDEDGFVVHDTTANHV